MESDRQLTVELHHLQSRVLELELTVRALERFWARVTADHADGTYDVRRMIATGPNVFADDPNDATPVLSANPAERGGYAGMYSIGDLVAVRFDGLDALGNPIYHIDSNSA